MENYIASDNKPSWTWADQVLTYRFWGLALFYIFSMAGVGLISSYLAYFLSNKSGAATTEISQVYVFQFAGNFMGFLLGWAAARWNGKHILLAAGLVQLLSVILLLQPTISYAVRLGSAWLFGFGTGAVVLGVPALLAGGRGGAQAFAGAFGLVTLLSHLEAQSTNLGMGSFINQLGLDSLVYGPAFLIGVGLIFLLLVDPVLFNVNPSVRLYQWPISRRDPLATGLLSLLFPFFWYYMYRFHGEAGSLIPSPRLLSPGGAFWACLFFPFFAPLMLMNLVEHLNELGAAYGRPALATPWVVFIWGIFLPPVAVGMVQSAINHTI